MISGHFSTKIREGLDQGNDEAVRTIRRSGFVGINSKVRSNLQMDTRHCDWPFIVHGELTVSAALKIKAYLDLSETSKLRSGTRCQELMQNLYSFA